MDFKKRAAELVSKMTLAEKLSQLRYDAPAIERLGIPAYNWWNEALHGYARSGVATVFPQAIALAASFDTARMRKVGSAISVEARAKYNEYRKFGDTGIYQGLTCWSPNINIFRDPRWGRGHETYGEDPRLTGNMGTAFVSGMQYGEGETRPLWRRVDATLKHYAVHSGPEALRHAFDAKVSQKDLRETYLAAFEQIIAEAAPVAVMGAYNRVNGEAACASPTLIGKIMRGEWGYDGYIVSDCGAICDICHSHRLAANEAEAAALALNNGCILNCGSAFRSLPAAVAAGLISEETVTEAAERLFRTRFELGMFDETEYDSIPFSEIDSPEHRALALQMSRESVVLLKNNGMLPLSDKHRRIAVIGPNADCVEALLGNYNGVPSEYETPLSGIRKLAAYRGVGVLYSPGCAHTSEDGERCNIRESVIAASHCDAVILCLGLTAGIEGEEGASGDKTGLALPEIQLSLWRALRETGKPIAVVCISGSAIDLRFAAEGADALLQCFYPGQDGGYALAEILFGECEPTAKLPVTFYADDSQLPPFEDYSMKDRTYRYFTGEPLYPFGYGIGYNRYTLSDISIPARPADGDAEVYASVKNEGSLSGAEVVQVYISYEGEPDAPICSLAGFTRVELAAGETRRVCVRIPAEAFMLYNSDGCRYTPVGEPRITVGFRAPVGFAGK